MNCILKCITSGAYLIKRLVIIFVVCTCVAAPSRAVNFMCPFPSIPPEGTKASVKLPDKQTAHAGNASAIALEGLQSFFSAIRQRELGNQSGYNELSIQAGNKLLESAKVFSSMEIKNKRYDLQFIRSIPTTKTGLPPVHNTAAAVNFLLKQIGATPPNSLVRTSDLITAARNATVSFAGQILKASGYSANDPQFESIRYRLANYVRFGDLLSRIGSATYFSLK